MCLAAEQQYLRLQAMHAVYGVLSVMGSKSASSTAKPPATEMLSHASCNPFRPGYSTSHNM